MVIPTRGRHGVCGLGGILRSHQDLRRCSSLLFCLFHASCHLSGQVCFSGWVCPILLPLPAHRGFLRERPPWVRWPSMAQSRERQVLWPRNYRTSKVQSQPEEWGLGLPFGITLNKGKGKDTEVPKKVLGEGLVWDVVMSKKERKAAAGTWYTVFFQSTAAILPLMGSSDTVFWPSSPWDVGSVFPPLTSGRKRVTALWPAGEWNCCYVTSKAGLRRGHSFHLALSFGVLILGS